MEIKKGEAFFLKEVSMLKTIIYKLCKACTLTKKEEKIVRKIVKGEL